MLFHMLLLSYSLLALVSLPLYEFFILVDLVCFFFFFSSRRRHTRSLYDWSSDVCSSDLTGEVPFRRPTPVETMHALAFDETPSMNSLRPNLPAELERIVSRCLQKRPEDRYPEARSLIEDLRVLRRETESGLVRRFSLKDRIGDSFDRLTHLKPSEYS